MSTSPLFTQVIRSVERGDFPRLRKWVWRRVYDVLSFSWRDGDWRFMNYGYQPPGAPFPLAAEDEPERPSIGLYQQALDGLPVEGARLLEVGCGRGGGLRWAARYRAPMEAVGLDYSAETVRRARRLNADTPLVAFRQGDAERLPFPDASFDVVLNIESSHCYADVPAFAREVARVLKPGGWFTFADMRPAGMVEALDRDLAVPDLERTEARDLTSGVVAALDAAEQRKNERFRRIRFGRRFVTEFSGAKGSTLYRALSAGDAAYVARRFRKRG